MICECPSGAHLLQKTMDYEALCNAMLLNYCLMQAGQGGASADDFLDKALSD